MDLEARLRTLERDVAQLKSRDRPKKQDRVKTELQVPGPTPPKPKPIHKKEQKVLHGTWSSIF